MMNAVDAFRIYVKIMMGSASEMITVYGVHRLLSAAEVPMTTGRSGKMHRLFYCCAK